jgi:hypothetical protein
MENINNFLEGKSVDEIKAIASEHGNIYDQYHRMLQPTAQESN